MLIGLILILGLVLILPFTVKKVEHNLEFFLFVMGLAATVVSGVLNLELLVEILENRLIYLITFAVLAAGFVFLFLKDRIKNLVTAILGVMPLKIFVFVLIVVLGLASSVITAIIAALVLVEIINVLPVKRRDKINLTIIACFSIGLGAVLTPVGEPLSTIVISKLNGNFWYLANLLGVPIVFGVLAMGLLGSFMVSKGSVGKQRKNDSNAYDKAHKDDVYFLDSDEEGGKETSKEVLLRAFKIYVFIFALELLGAGFKPFIDTYVINLDSRLLYFINMISAVLDNATLAAAEVSAKMQLVQIKAVLLGLLISGGMLIPGNIPNIISAHKLKISSKEWARLGVPVGSALMLIFFVVIFIF